MCLHSSSCNLIVLSASSCHKRSLKRSPSNGNFFSFFIFVENVDINALDFSINFIGNFVRSILHVYNGAGDHIFINKRLLSLLFSFLLSFFAFFIFFTIFLLFVLILFFIFHFFFYFFHRDFFLFYLRVSDINHEFIVS